MGKKIYASHTDNGAGSPPLPTASACTKQGVSKQPKLTAEHIPPPWALLSGINGEMMNENILMTKIKTSFQIN